MSPWASVETISRAKSNACAFWNGVPFLFVILVIPRNFVSFENVVDLTLRYPLLFLANLKTYEAWVKWMCM
jgi:hypothetical protein